VSCARMSLLSEIECVMEQAEGGMSRNALIGPKLEGS
jgi:hypothetical protein